jgi:putative transposase
MPRKPRFNLIGMPQHVIQRGNNREPCFYAEEDYRRYLDDLHTSAEKFQCCIHAYVQKWTPKMGQWHKCKS